MSSERHDHWSSIYGSSFSAPDPYAHLPAGCSDLFRYGDAWSSHQPAAAPLAWPSCSETPPPQPSRTIACHSDASAFVPRPTTVWTDVSASLTTERQDGAPPHQTADVVAASPQAFWPPPAPPGGALRDPRETSPAFFPGQARAPPLTLQQEGNVRAGARGIRAPFSTTGEPSATGGRRRNRRQKGELSALGPDTDLVTDLTTSWCKNESLSGAESVVATAAARPCYGARSVGCVVGYLKPVRALVRAAVEAVGVSMALLGHYRTPA